MQTINVIKITQKKQWSNSLQDKISYQLQLHALLAMQKPH